VSLSGERVLAGDRRSIEQQLRHHLGSDPISVRLPMLRLVEAGGKRVRPLLVTVCARLGARRDHRRALQLAVAFELLHSATLVHDDYVDRASTRRGHATVAAGEGPAVAIAVGDYYFAKATHLTALLGCPQVSITMAGAIERIGLAQLEETCAHDGYPGRRETYLHVARGKTAALFAAACRAGAELVSADAEVVDRAARFGERLGIAFQMYDDVLDYRDGTGKPVAQDVRQRVMSLPLIYACEHPDIGGRVSELLRAARSETAVDEVLRLLDRSGALDRVRAEALDVAGEAMREASGFVVPAVRSALALLVRMVTDGGEG
jgi:octaprenyl-diphosphate synthase